MRFFRFLFLAAALAPFALPSWAAEKSDTHWVHIAIDGTSDGGERVRVNLPLKLITSLEPILDRHLGEGNSTLEIDGKKFTLAELREILVAIEAADDGEFISIKDQGDDVRIFKKKDILEVRVVEKKGENVSLQVPVPVLKALVSGTGDDLNLGAGLRALAEFPTQARLTVNDGDEKIRIWVDQENLPDEE